MENIMIKNYFDDLIKVLSQINPQDVEKVVDCIFEAYQNDKQIFIMGNGGSASTASHFACDLGKGTIVDNKKRLRVISLNDNMAIITAFANDYGYDDIFAEQLKNLVNANDIVIGISASGNSANVIKGVEYAKTKGAVIVGFTGFSGGKLMEISDINIHIDNHNYGQVEDTHMVLEHAISQSIKDMVKHA
jgi:D-sedoheptulose 7-phosphate isomerase